MTATLSSHILNAVDGTHAAGVKVSLVRAAGRSGTVFESETDAGGRLAEKIDLSASDPQDCYELTVFTGPYWRGRSDRQATAQIMDEIVVRFKMPDPLGRYHIPIIASPNGYSIWWSG